ncbi:MAG: hypothetical protein ACWA5T_02665 [Parvularcula sp.]
MSDTSTIVLDVGGENIPLNASLEALEHLSQEFGIAHVRDLMAVLLNPSPGQLISILSAFAGAAGVVDPRAVIARRSIDLGAALAAVARAITPASASAREGERV